MPVYGLIPKLYMPSERDMSLATRVRTIRENTVLARRLKAQRIPGEASRCRHNPNLVHFREVENLVPGDGVLVYR